MTDLVTLEKRESIGLITLCHIDKYNVLSKALIKKLNENLMECESDPLVKCLIIQGHEKAFSAGADLKEVSQMSYEDALNEDFIQQWQYLSTISKPVIACVSGFAMGGGLELALMCDMIIATPEAKFAFPEIKVGVLPGAGGIQRLVSILGSYKASWLLLSGETFSGEKAQELGLVTFLADQGSLLTKALELASRLGTYSLPILKSIKNCIRTVGQLPIDEGINYEKMAFYKTFLLEDHQIGIKAFLNKENPQFKDC